MSDCEMLLPLELAAIIKTATDPSANEKKKGIHTPTSLTATPIPVAAKVSETVPLPTPENEKGTRKRKVGATPEDGTRKRRVAKKEPDVDLENEAVRNTLPLKFFCNASTYQGTTDTLVSKRMQNMLEIRRKRKERNKARERMLANATTTQEEHRIRRQFEREEEKHREEEHLVLNGMTLLTENVAQKDSFQPTGNDTPSAASKEAHRSSSGPKVRVVNGQIVMDMEHTYTSLLHASQKPQKNLLDRPVLEEIHHYYNQAHFLSTTNRKSPRWRPDELEVFYQGLAAWGLNFEAIARMIPGKTRKNVKNKYKSENIKAKAKVEEALLNKKTMGIYEYAEATGLSFQS